ncbi:MAG: LamG-like jellyroll fold domain-containing protein, partial [Verrucomicrobiota bacterium]
VPFINKPIASITDFTIEVSDFAPIIADTNTIALSVNGQAVTPTSVSKKGTITTIKYAPAVPFPSQSLQNTKLSINDTTGLTYTDEASFTVPYYATIPASLKVTTADTSKSGFVWNVFQNEADQSNSNARAEREVAGDMTNPDGTPMLNLADPNAVGVATGVGTPADPGSKPIHFEIEGVVNMSQTEGESNGNFPNDGQMPGIPGTSGSTDGIGAELVAWVELPKGWVTMGVNSDDGFATAAGLAGDKFQEIVLGVADVGRGATDSIFRFLVEEAGVYKLRTIWEEGNGGANIEWFTVKDDGTKVLLNDTASGGFKTYRAVTGNAPVVAKVTRVVPAINATTAKPNLLAVDIRDGATAIETNSVHLTVDGAPVTAKVTKTGPLTTATYTPASLLASGSKHQATVEYTDGGNKITRQWDFTVATYTPSLDTLHKYAGLLMGNARFTTNSGGFSGKPGDYGLDLTQLGGASWVDIVDATFLNDPAKNDRLSVAFWVYRYDINAGSAFWANSISAGRGFQGHTPWSDDTVYFDTMGCCDAGTQRINANINTFDDYNLVGNDTWWNRWHHFVFEKNADQKNIYIDGKLFLNGSNTNPLLGDFTEMSLGTDGIPGGNFMHAIMDDFAVFSTAVSAENAAKLAQGAAPASLTNETLIALWEFNDVSTQPGGDKALAVSLSADRANITLTFTGTLQSADTVLGPWTNVNAATSPTTVPVAGGSKFYRVQ